MTVSVIVPRAGDCPHREAAWQWLRPRYADYEIVEGHTSTRPWCKADAVRDALGRATGDTLVITDADVWSAATHDAIQAVVDGAQRWSVPFIRVYRLNRDATSRVLGGEEPNARLKRAKPPYRGTIGGGVVVLRRDLYDECPLDSRFIGWGGEDVSWGYALRTLAGKPFTPAAHLWHLWHPPQKISDGKFERPESTELTARYRRAFNDVDAMRALVGEVHQ